MVYHKTKHGKINEQSDLINGKYLKTGLEYSRYRLFLLMKMPQQSASKFWTERYSDNVLFRLYCVNYVMSQSLSFGIQAITYLPN